MYPQLADHTEKAGRAVVRRVLAATMPQLDQLRQMLDYRRNQIQATAEHNQLTTANAFQNQVLGQLAGMRQSGGWSRF
jgi:hypothetical protein